MILTASIPSLEIELTRKMLRYLSGVFRPQLLEMFREGYSWKAFARDVIAGIIVGIVALPLAIAFGIASLGSTPDAVQRGLFTAIIAGFIISCLSGSKVQVGGPTGAFIVIIFGIVSNPEMGVNGLICATVLAGILLLVMGLTGLGSLVRYIPYPVTLGFTSGIAVVIAASQLQMFFGIDLGEDKLPGSFVGKIQVLFEHVDAINPYAFALAFSTVAVILFTEKISKQKIPGSLVAVVIGTVLVALLGIPVDTIGQQVGKEPVSLALGFPVFTVPSFDITKIEPIVSAAITIALLGAIESLLSAVVADEMINTKHHSNTELIAQGVANIVTPFFGGIPSTGAIARTATNIRSGGRTPIAGIVHALVLLLIVLCFGKYAAMIPMPVLAGVLMTVAVRMSHGSLLIKMFRAPKSDVSVLWITLLLTVFLDLTVAIPAGMILASFLFMRRMELLFTMGNITDRLSKSDENLNMQDSICIQIGTLEGDLPRGVQAFNMDGPFFFGTAGKFQAAIDDQTVPVIILRMKHVPAMDITGLNALEDLILRAKSGNTTILFTDLQPQPLHVIERFGMIEHIGEENIHKSLNGALVHAAKLARAALKERETQPDISESAPPIDMTNVFISPSS